MYELVIEFCDLRFPHFLKNAVVFPADCLPTRTDQSRVFMGLTINFHPAKPSWLHESGVLSSSSDFPAYSGIYTTHHPAFLIINMISGIT